MYIYEYTLYTVFLTPPPPAKWFARCIVHQLRATFNFISPPPVGNCGTSGSARWLEFGGKLRRQIYFGRWFPSDWTSWWSQHYRDFWSQRLILRFLSMNASNSQISGRVGWVLQPAIFLKMTDSCWMGASSPQHGITARNMGLRWHWSQGVTFRWWEVQGVFFSPDICDPELWWKCRPKTMEGIAWNDWRRSWFVVGFFFHVLWMLQRLESWCLAFFFSKKKGELHKTNLWISFYDPCGGRLALASCHESLPFKKKKKLATAGKMRCRWLASQRKFWRLSLGNVSSKF